MKPLAILLSLLLVSKVVFTQANPSQQEKEPELRRKVSLGFRPIPIGSSSNTKPETEQVLQEAKGILVANVQPSGSFYHIGVQLNDTLISINGIETNTIPDLLAARDPLRAGDQMKLLVKRGKKKLTLTGKALALPMESSSTSTVLYNAFNFKDGLVRTIINKPNTPGKHPVIFFIPGYTCASIDNNSQLHPYRKLVDSLVNLGYAVFRMEKPGIGDNENTGDCSQLGFDNELESYLQGYKQLSRYDFIDTDNIFVWGHSMGGIYAPILASHYNPKGVIVYGIIHDTWTEYLLRMVRYQNPLLGSSDYINTDQDVRTLYALLYEHYHLGISSKELFKNEAYKEILTRDFQFDGENQILYRHEDFWRELYAHNLSQHWAKTSSFVLSLNGEADIQVVNSFSQEQLVNVVNHYHPGKGEFFFFPKTDHSMIKVGTMEEGVALSGKPAYRTYLEKHFNYDIVTKTHTWIQSKLNMSL